VGVFPCRGQEAPCLARSLQCYRASQGCQFRTASASARLWHQFAQSGAATGSVVPLPTKARHEIAVVADLRVGARGSPRRSNSARLHPPWRAIARGRRIGRHRPGNLPSLDAYDVRTYRKRASAGRTASAERDPPACFALVDLHRRTSFAPYSADLGRAVEGGFVMFQSIHHHSLVRRLAS
jgi:hypothetical protein